MAYHLSAAQCASFHENGYLAVEDLLNEEDLAPLEREYEILAEGLAQDLLAAGKIQNAHEGLGFVERYERLLADYPAATNYFNISLPLVNGPIDPEDFHMHAGPSAFRLLRNEKILDVVESIIGPEIASSPVLQMRIKPPTRNVKNLNMEHSNVGPTTWHQDIVAILPEADHTNQLTVWVAITDATELNGCLVCVPKSHKKGPLVHCANESMAREPHVPAVLTDGMKPVPLPLKRGGVILFDKHNLHSGLPNLSDGLRWSADIRYHPVGQASGRPAFPGFVARSKADPAQELHDPAVWQDRWVAARERIVRGEHGGVIFADNRWADPAIC
ncbi:MAG: phytanoyl-CoA dioxygenase family protein [Pseudomonadota bacterium]